MHNILDNSYKLMKLNHMNLENIRQKYGIKVKKEEKSK